MYSAFPELKDEQNLREIGDMQTKAQLDALKRFIQTMENDAVAQKRTAQEQRFMNQKFDKSLRVEYFKKEKKARETKNAVLQQANEKKERMRQKNMNDKA